MDDDNFGSQFIVGVDNSPSQMLIADPEGLVLTITPEGQIEGDLEHALKVMQDNPGNDPWLTVFTVIYRLQKQVEELQQKDL